MAAMTGAWAQEPAPAEPDTVETPAVAEPTELEAAQDELVEEIECVLCTDEERDALRLRSAQRTAQALNRLVGELEELARYPGVATALLQDGDEDLQQTLVAVLRHIQAAQRAQRAASQPSRGPAPAPARPAAVTKKENGKKGEEPAEFRAVFATTGNAERGIPARAIVRSDGRDKILRKGMTTNHRSRTYTLVDVRATAESDVLEVVLARDDNRQEILPW